MPRSGVRSPHGPHVEEYCSVTIGVILRRFGAHLVGSN